MEGGKRSPLGIVLHGLLIRGCGYLGCFEAFEGFPGADGIPVLILKMRLGFTEFAVRDRRAHLFFCVCARACVRLQIFSEGLRFVLGRSSEMSADAEDFRADLGGFRKAFDGYLRYFGGFRQVSAGEWCPETRFGAKT